LLELGVQVSERGELADEFGAAWRLHLAPRIEIPPAE
jgi:hypothetical protein